MDNKKTMKDFALTYAKNGFAVTPLKYMTKNIFLSERGFNDATTDIKQVNEWWSKSPAANIAIATGQKSGGILVLDFDVKEESGIYGLDTLKAWERRNGNLPNTWMTISGGGGYHYYYKTDLVIGSDTGLFAKDSGVDIRAEGGCIIVPPSIHPSGKQYIWECSSWDCELAEANGLVYQFIFDGVSYKKLEQAKRGSRFVLPDEIHQGERDDVMFKLACSLLAKGIDKDRTLIIMLQANSENCIPPLPKQIIIKKLRSAIRLKSRGVSE